jgi:hypothetical protein
MCGANGLRVAAFVAAELLAAATPLLLQPAPVRCLGIRTGCPMHTGQTLVLGSSPYWLAQLQKALVRVSSCTCDSMPITASYCNTTREQGEPCLCVLTQTSVSRT